MTTPVRRFATIATVAVIALVVAITATRSHGNDGTMKVHAVFADVSPLLPGNDVRMNGVQVGTVGPMKQVPQGADVVLNLNRSALPLYRNATASIRPDSLLGERYIELQPGTGAAGAMVSGGTIPRTATSVSTDLDTVLNSLDDPTAAALAALVGTLGDGLAGNGASVRDAVKALAPALTNTDQVAGILKGQDQVLGQLVTSMESVASGLATDDGASIDRLVGSASDVLSSTAVQQQALRSVIQQLPATIATAERTLGGLEQTANQAEPTLRALRPTTSQLSAIGTEVTNFADAAKPALTSADPVLERASKLLQAARPVAAELRKAGPSLQSDAKSLEPLSRDITLNLTPVFEFIRGWALTTNGRDGLSHYFRANVVLTSGIVTGAIPSTTHVPTVQLPGAGTPPLSGSALPNLGLDGVLSGLGNTLNGVTNGLSNLTNGLTSGLGGGGAKANNSGGGSLLGGLLSPRTSADGGVTGLSRRQELGAMAFMLGGSHS